VLVQQIPIPLASPHPMVQCIKPADAHSPIPSLVGVGGVHQVLSDLGPRSASPQATQQCLTEYLVIYKVLKVPNSPCFHLLWIHTSQACQPGWSPHHSPSQNSP
jgi:hypothetical protein